MAQAAVVQESHIVVRHELLPTVHRTQRSAYAPNHLGEEAAAHLRVLLAIGTVTVGGLVGPGSRTGTVARQ